MEFQTSKGAGGRQAAAGFSLIEVMIAASVLAIGLGSLVAVNSQVISLLRRSASASFASQLIQERMEQFRRAAWTDITSDYPPDDADETLGTYDADGGSVTYPYYPPEFPDLPAQSNAFIPGMMELMAVPAVSGAQLRDVVERVKVEAYNASNSNLTVWDCESSNCSSSNQTQITISPFTPGGTPIVVERRNGVVTKITHNPVLSLTTTVRLTFTVTWTGTDNVQRKKETVTLFTVEGDK